MPKPFVGQKVKCPRLQAKLQWIAVSYIVLFIWKSWIQYNCKMFLCFIRFETFEKEINKKSDTLYIVSFRGVSSIPILLVFVRFNLVN